MAPTWRTRRWCAVIGTAWATSAAAAAAAATAASSRAAGPSTACPPILPCLQVGHTDFVSAVAYAPPGLLEGCLGGAVVSGSRDTTVMVWDLQTATPVQRLEGHQYQVGNWCWVLFMRGWLLLQVEDVAVAAQCGRPRHMPAGNAWAPPTAVGRRATAVGGQHVAAVWHTQQYSESLELMFSVAHHTLQDCNTRTPPCCACPAGLCRAGDSRG